MWAAFMKSAERREILCTLSALLLAAWAYLRFPAIYARLPENERAPVWMPWCANALQQILLFALPALLMLAAREFRWQGFLRSLRPVRSDTAACSLLLAAGGTVVASLIASVWSVFLGTLGYTAAQPPLPVPGNTREWVILLLAVAVIPAACEEMLFRALLQGMLCRWLPRAGIWIAAAVFAALHFRWTAFPALLLVGAVLGWMYMRYGYWAGFLLHTLYNAVVLVLSARQVSVTLLTLLACAGACAVSLFLLFGKERSDETDCTWL